MDIPSAKSHSHSWGGAIAPAGARAQTPRFELGAEDSAAFLRIVSESTLIESHYGIYRWLQGEVQQFLPHEILLCAWGDFAHWRLAFDVTSGLPGVRTALLARCPLDAVVRRAHARWLQAARQPLLARVDELLEPHECSCPMHAALCGMRSLLVHGTRDQRSGEDSLYLAFSSGALARGGSKQRFAAVADALVSQIDNAYRRVAVFALPSSPVLDLSQRECEILRSVCEGKTNVDIAVALAISPFTVKNHVQRIFRKIGVSNRTQAAARYQAASRGAAA